LFRFLRHLADFLGARLAVAIGGGGGIIALIVAVAVSPRCTFTIFH
jgi:hypothetical protein